MDKQEQREIIGEIKKAYARGDFTRVLEYAGELNLRKLGDSRTLEMVADAHAACGQLEDARDVLLMAYEKTPMGRKMAYKLSELSIALDNLDDAVEFYEDFCKMAPHDNDRYLLKYKIGKAGGVAPEDLVKVLAAYCSREVDEKWMYELAALYYKLHEKEKCLEICDNIILWFANGDYVRKAEALKMRLGEEAAAQAAPQEKEIANTGVIGQDIPVEGFIDMSGQQDAPKVEEESLDDFDDSFLEEALEDDTPDKNMAIGDAMALAEAKEQAEFVNAAENFEVFRETPKPRVREIVPVVRKYEQLDESISFDTKPETVLEANQMEVNGEVITLPKTTFEDMSHDWTIPEELLNAEDVNTPVEEFEEPVYGAHRYVPPTEREAAFEEPVYGSHRVMTKAEEEAAKAAMEQELEEAGNNMELEEVVQEAPPVSQIPPAEVAPVFEEPVAEEPAVVETAPAVETIPAAPEIPEAEVAPVIPAMEVAPEIPAEEIVVPQAPVAEPQAPAVEPAPQEAAPELPEEEMMKATDNPIIAAVIEPVHEEEPEELHSWNQFDSGFPPTFSESQAPAEKPAEEGGEEKPSERTAEARAEAEGTILFAIAPTEDDATPDTLVLPETADAESVTKSMEKTATAVKEPEPVKPQPAPQVRTPEPPKPEKVPLSFSLTPEPAHEEKPAPPVQTEVIRPAGSSKYSSVNSLFAEEETDNIDGQITLDSMFATYSRKEVREEPVIPEPAASVNRPVEPEIIPEQPEVVAATVEEAPVWEEPAAPAPKAADATDDGEPPLITDLAGSFGEYEDAPAFAERKYGNTVSEEPPYDVPIEPEPVFEEPAIEEPAAEAAADAELSDFEKAMLAFDAARAEGKEGFDFQSLLAKSTSEEERDEIFGELDAEEYIEQRFDGEEDFEESEEYDEYEDDEYADEYEDEYEEEEDFEETAPETDELADDYEVGFGDEEEAEFEEEFDEYEEEPEEYEEGFEEEFDETFDEEEPSFEEEFDEYEDEDYVDDEYEDEEPYEEEPYEEDFDEEEEFEEEAEYEEEPYEEEAYEEEPYEDEAYEEEEGYEEEAEYDEEEEYEEEYEDEYEDEYSDYEGGYVMPDDLKEELAEFLLIDGMEERINTAIDSLIEKKRHGDPTGGNLIVTGDTKSGKTYLTIAVIKAVGKEIGGNSRVAKVNAQALNGKNMQKVFEKIAGSDLLIENVGYLSDETVESLIDILRRSNLSSMVALEGNQLAIDNMISNHPILKDLFQTRLNVKELNLTQWADLACQYAEEKGYTVSDMALLALHAKIDELNIPTARLGYEDIKGIIDNAIANASKRGGGKFRFGSKKNKGNAKQLDEADFM